MPFYWTQRALEREGFAVHSNDQALNAPQIRILNDPLRWEVTTVAGEQLVMASLYELLHALRDTQYQPSV